MNKSEELLERIKNLPADKQAKLFQQLDKDESQKIPRVTNSQFPARASYAQEGLWNVYEIEGQNDKYNMPSAYQLKNELDQRALERSFEYVVGRHESLRTSFAKEDGELFQTIHGTDSFSLNVYDLQDLSEEEQTKQTYDLIESVGAYHFDLESEPLFLASLVRLANDYHVLLICAHHIVFDGYSKAILLRELRACYEHYTRTGEIGEPTLSELPIQYSDFARWESEQEYLDQQVDYWARKLKDAPHLLNVGDKKRVNERESDGFSVPISLPSELANKVKTLGRNAGCSPFMTMLSTFAIALSRYSQQTEVLIGTPIESRRQQELSGMIGYFLNTTVMDIHIDETLNFADILQRVKDSCTEAYSKQEAPFNRVVEAVNPVRSLNVSPLFQAMFVFQVVGANELSLPGLEITQIDNEKVDIRDLDKAYSAVSQELSEDQFVEFKSHTKFDLYLTFIEEEDGSLGGWFTYNKNVMSQDYVRNFLINYVNFIESVVQQPKLALHRVLAMTQQDQVQFELLNNETELTPSIESTIHLEFERQARKVPDVDALIYNDERLTFSQVNQKANKLANYLRASGVLQGDVVGVAMSRCLESVIAPLAVLKAGGVYLSLDPKLPVSRLDSYLQSANVEMVICVSPDSQFSENSIHKENMIFLDELSNELEAYSSCDLELSTTFKQEAYLLYTSGSTGLPKGVIASHEATLNRLSWMWDEYPYSDDEVLCHKTTCSFVDAIAEVWGGLLRGRPLVIVSDEQAFDLYEFVNALKDHRVTRLTLVPSLLLSMLDHYPELGDSLPDLKFVVCSGEALREDLVRRFYEAFDGASLLNLYGSTEVAADATHYLVSADAEPGCSIPIGKPIKNCQTYVLDRYLNPCPVGVAGELYVGGTVVAMSYYGDPRLTAEKFVPNPFSSSGERLFRTNDQARLRRSGELDYLGRKDNQVKLRGFRIHLDEIQNQLNQHEAIKSSVVVLSEVGANGSESDGADDAVLVAYVIQEEVVDQPLTVDITRLYLRENLPDYMVPKHIEFILEFPLLENGKVDRKNLPTPDFSTLSAVAYVEPESDIEKQLAELWQRLLNVPRAGINDNFFDLGGHSIVAARVATEIRKIFDLDIQIQDIFNFLTIAELARYIDSLMLAQSLTNTVSGSTSSQDSSSEEVFEF